MNKVMMIGNLAADPEIRKTSSDISVCTFRIAVNRKFSNAQGVKETDFFPVVAWRQLGELCAKYLFKGKKCAVTGSLQTRTYDAQDGTKRYITEIVADDVEFLSGSQSGAPHDDQAPPPEVPPRSTGAAAPSASSGFAQVDDDDLPF